ncbi:MAG TPA: UPF0182 family protein [Vicinamibacterales bacterium]|nr:UPF0182 family protein [Vicinamibacterales bacterium]
MPRTRLPLLLLLLLLVTAIPSMAEFYVDWLWYREVGYEQVFLRTLSARASIGLLTGLVAFAVLWVNLRLSLAALRRREFVITTPEGPRVITVETGRLRTLAYVLAGIVSVFIGLFSGSQWETWLYYIYATPFGRVDPVLGRDIGFYVFSLPMLNLLHGLALTTLVLATAGSLAGHVASGAVGLDPTQGFFATRSARRHLAVLLAAVLAVLAFGAWLRVPDLLTSPSGVVTGATYVDVHARMPAFRLLMVAAILGAALALYQATVPRFWPIGAAIGLYAVVTFGGGAYAAIIQRFVVGPNEQVRETPYIIHNIQATREAFALDQVDERPLSGEARLTRGDLDRNTSTIENVPLWNDQPLLDTFGQIQEIRTYYDFVSVDNDRYTINGRYRQIMLSARELNSSSLPSRTWINERLTFTHGYGLTLGPVNEVTPEGLPVLFIRDLPPTSTVDLKVSQPALYYGELSNDHVFVRTKTQEFDYPRGDDNVFTSYEGEGGVPMTGLFRRLMFALRFRSTDTFFSPNLTAESRVMMHRRIRDRVGRIAPFLTFDPDPYLAISNGRLIWIQDAYTTTHRYPYSSAVPGANVNYIRNAIKATVDGYHGTTTFHLLDANDPIARTISKVFPGLFRPIGEMPEDLRTRLRYPQMIFSIQAAMFATFHMTNPAVFYNREDQWEIPAFDVGGQSLRMEPYYTIMKLPGEEGPEYIQMLPFTPRQKDNLAAWMVARSDGEHYGRLVAFQFPKQTVIFGPRQIAARISQDQVIAPQITLWNQQGSEVIQGTLLVIPIESSLIYIRPLYLRAAGGRIPELKRVIVAHQNQIVMEETLDEALDRLFPTDGGPRPATPTQPEQLEPAEAQPPAAGGAVDVLAQRAREHYERAIRAQREGNWAQYGEEIRRLGEILEQMSRRRQ